MVPTPIRPVKSATPHFATPPWDRSSPQWIDIDQRLPHDHLARLIDEAVARLDLQPLLRSYAGRGSRAYHPALVLRIVLYQLACGVHPPGRWAHNCRLHDELKWLGFGICPSRSRLDHFQKRLGDQLDAWFRQVIEQAVARGLTPATRAALDGSTIAANASRHRLLNRKTLDQRLVVLAQAVAADGPAPEATAPPAADGPAPRPWWMATTPRGRRRQLTRYQEARAALGRLLAANARRKAERRRDPEKIVIAPSDPEATPGRDKLAVFRPLYNAQIAYDLDSELILATEVFAQQNDTGTLPVMLTVFSTWVGHVPSVLLTDAGYATVIDATACAAVGAVLYAPYQTNDYSDRGAVPAAGKGKDKGKGKGKAARMLPKERFTWDATRDVYICPAGHAMPRESSKRERRVGEQAVVRYCYRCAGAHCQTCPLRATCTPNPAAGRSVRRVEGEEVIEALRERMQTKEAKALYKRRRSTVERSYADLKVHRDLDRFSSRGLVRVRVQLRLQCLVHNLLVLARYARAQIEETEQKRAAG